MTVTCNCLMLSLANVRILKSYYALLLTSVKTKELSTRLLGYQGTTITGKHPQLRGDITWIWTKNNKFLRERFFHLQGRNQRSIPLSPERLRPIFKVAKYLLLDKTLSFELKEGIRGYIKDFQFPLNIKEFENCPYCVLADRITLMIPKKYYIGLNNDNICQLCALQELQRELKSRDVHLTPSIMNYLRVLLQQSKNVPKALEILAGNQHYGTGSIIKSVDRLVGEYHSPTPLEKLKTPLPAYIVKNLHYRKIKSLLPTQVKALSAGLLQTKNNDLLIVAETSAGKTLIGEIAALKTIIKLKKQVLYLAPLVALANTKYESFRKNFKHEGFKIGLRVGLPRIILKNRKTKLDSRNLRNKDIIVGTYEGFDQLLRQGQSFKNIGLVIIDEIQELAQEDRGPDLDGLISRLKLQQSDIQILGLSATIGNPEALAHMLQYKLVQYKGRPVPLEVHVLVNPSELRKKDRILEIVDTERKIRSKFGFIGQTIIFTNSRRKTREIRDFLRNNGIRTANYHSGLAYGIRKKIEEDFEKGTIDAVAATYALGAGVDFPASTVIFESVQMGKDLLSDKTNIFFQMMGRAGRLGKHEKGKVILLATPYPPNASVQKSELEIAMFLLNAAKYEDVEPEYDLNIVATQLLATLSSFPSLTNNRWKKSFNYLIGKTGTFEEARNFLQAKHLIINQDSGYKVSKLGRAGSRSFLTVSDIGYVQTQLKSHSALEIAILMEPFENIHLAPRLIGFMEKALKTRVSSRLFNSSALELLDSASVRVAKLDKHVLATLMQWSQLFFNCGCPDTPYCDHGVINVNKLLLQLRFNGYGPKAISSYIEKKFGLYAYPGDILRWLESLLHRLEGIQKITAALSDHDTENQVNLIIGSLEDPAKISIQDERLQIISHPL